MDADAAPKASLPHSTRRRALTSPQSNYPTKLPLSRIVKGDNPRRYFDRKKHEEMVASIRLRGIIQPILLRPRGDVFAIVAGRSEEHTSELQSLMRISYAVFCLK